MSDAYTAPQASVVSAVVVDAVWEQKPSAGGQTFDYAITIRARESQEKSISFYVNGIKADQVAAFMGGGVTVLDLTVRVP